MITLADFQSRQWTNDDTTGLIVIGAGVAFGLAILIVECILLHGALKRVPQEHRQMEPALVWLLLIPLFNYIWNFFVFHRVSDSYQRHFRSQGWASVGDCGQALGLWYSILSAVSIGTCIPILGCLLAPVPFAAFVLLIIYMVKILTLKGQIRPINPAVPPIVGNGM